MKTAYKIYRQEIEVIKELYNLGLISHIDKINQETRVKFLYITQKKDSE